jgi:superfamily II DNA or RNA helicase
MWYLYAEAPMIEDFERMLGQPLFDWQKDAVLGAQVLAGVAPRTCLYYKTGAGKTITGLLQMVVWGQTEVVVISPPATHDLWVATGRRLNVDVQPMSHARFRMPDTRLSRKVAVIADEMHLFGGHGGKGWVKLDTMARHLQAPLVLASATPNYNDAERVYCIKHVLDPHGTKGGYLEFLYANCETEENPFGREPKVTGFRSFPDAAAYLAALDGVFYLPDDLTYTVQDLPVSERLDFAFRRFGFNRREERVVASQMEERHQRVKLSLIDDDGLLRHDVYLQVDALLQRFGTPALVYANHATVATAYSQRLLLDRVAHGLVTGSTTQEKKLALLGQFRGRVFDVLVGTASLATGTDGLDKACDVLIIIDDTDDDSLRRQLIGRIMPRGVGGNASKKRVFRLVLQ